MPLKAIYRVLQKGTAKLSGNIPHTQRKKICYVDMCPETLNFHARAHFSISSIHRQLAQLKEGNVDVSACVDMRLIALQY